MRRMSDRRAAIRGEPDASTRACETRAESAIQSLVPSGVVAVDDGNTRTDEEDLFPEEAALVFGSVAKRRQEFAAGRVCARHALARLGLPDVPILAGKHAEPLWPPSVVGSITHCSGYAAAAVAKSTTIRSIGIDAERNMPLPPGTEELVCNERERRWLRSVRDGDGINWATLIFSAKESLYKAWFPLTHRWLDFSEAEIAVDRRRRSFVPRLYTPFLMTVVDGAVWEGRLALHGDHLLTSVVVS